MVAEEYLIIVLAAIVGAIVANIEFALLGSPGAGGRRSRRSRAVRFPDRRSPGPRLRRSSSRRPGRGDRVGSQQRDRTRRATLPAHPRGLVAFSAGGSQVGLAIGPLIPLSGELESSR